MYPLKKTETKQNKKTNQEKTNSDYGGTWDQFTYNTSAGSPGATNNRLEDLKAVSRYTNAVRLVEDDTKPGTAEGVEMYLIKETFKFSIS